MVKMILLFLPFFCILCLSVTGQESVKLLNLHDTTALGVSVDSSDFEVISGSVLMAEKWLRTHVLSHYPGTEITTIVVGDNVVCQNDEEHRLVLVLPVMKNIYHSLVRWGLEKEISVSVGFSSQCLNQKSEISEKVMKSLIEFLVSTNSTYLVYAPSKLSPLSDEMVQLVSAHKESMKKLGFLQALNVNVIVTSYGKDSKPTSRNLLSNDPFPARPIPMPENGQSPFTAPANVAKKPPPRLTFPYAPQLPPVFVPAPSPYGFTMPPCNPADTAGAPAPMTEVVQRLWCVAKPSVPADALQEAIDYACGAGGADCEEIAPQGSCYNPETVVAHASYAFNSYWQKNKRNGGTCNFGGTAMIINSDPSFLQCRFVLT